MKRNTIKWRIFKYNLIVIISLIVFTTIIFNIAVRQYIERDILAQLNKIASRAEDTALRQEPPFPPPHLPPPPKGVIIPDPLKDNDIFRYYFMLDRSLREPLSVLNADYVILDKDKNRINPFPEEFFIQPEELLDQITNVVTRGTDFSTESTQRFKISDTEYLAIVKPVYQKNESYLGWIIIFSSLGKVNQLQLVINIILLVIFLLSSIIVIIISSIISKKISEPFSSLNQHIKELAQRNFGTKINMTVDNELQEFVNNINNMTEKLQIYDKAQKTFLQNASHELRTPLMSIQSHAEGIKYDVIDKETGVNIIIDETMRMTSLVEELLYLSRLDTIEENYHFENLDFKEALNSCIERMNGIAVKSNIGISVNFTHDSIRINADEEKFSRAITNIIGNCIRYASSSVVVKSIITEDKKVELTISDDGPGFEVNELPYIFSRFYKGKKGIFGLGLAISKNVIEKHCGEITAQNSKFGAVFEVKLPLA